MREIRPRGPYDIRKSSPYEGPYRRPHNEPAIAWLAVVTMILYGVVVWIWSY
jgi:hypothetical protein